MARPCICNVQRRDAFRWLNAPPGSLVLLAELRAPLNQDIGRLANSSRLALLGFTKRDCMPAKRPRAVEGTRADQHFCATNRSADRYLLQVMAMSVSLIILGILLGSGLFAAAVHIALRRVHKLIWRAPLESFGADESDQQQLVRYGFNAVRGFAASLDDLSIPEIPAALQPIGFGSGDSAQSRGYAA
jgi:hypothetical protein